MDEKRDKCPVCPGYLHETGEPEMFRCAGCGCLFRLLTPRYQGDSKIGNVVIPEG